MANAEKLALQQRIDNLQEHIDHLHGVITDYERQNAKLKAGMEAVKRERDAAIIELKIYTGCKVCKYGDFRFPTPCLACDKNSSSWEWRGLCAENGGAEDA